MTEFTPPPERQWSLGDRCSVGSSSFASVVAGFIGEDRVLIATRYGVDHHHGFDVMHVGALKPQNPQRTESEWANLDEFIAETPVIT